MNIRSKGIWPTEHCPSPTKEVFLELIYRRFHTFTGFVGNEKDKGFIKTGVSLEEPQGQEMLRILFFRVIEEYSESIDSTSQDHILEELIDCINYLWSCRLLESKTLAEEEGNLALFAEMMYNAWITVHPMDPLPPEVEDLGELSLILGRVGDLLRNRAWMVHPQDIHFTGREALDKAIIYVSMIIFESFKNFEEFWRYYVAKDNVLQFRLRSKY